MKTCTMDQMLVKKSAQLSTLKEFLIITKENLITMIKKCHLRQDSKIVRTTKKVYFNDYLEDCSKDDFHHLLFLFEMKL